MIVLYPESPVPSLQTLQNREVVAIGSAAKNLYKALQSQQGQPIDLLIFIDPENESDKDKRTLNFHLIPPTIPPQNIPQQAICILTDAKSLLAPRIIIAGCPNGFQNLIVPDATEWLQERLRTQ